MKYLSVPLLLFVLVVPNASQAQECNPSGPNTCPGTQVCSCTGPELAGCTQGRCVAEEITISGDDARGISFARFVNNTLVPFVDGYVIRFLYALAFLMFVLGVARGFFLSAENEEYREQGKQLAVWGLVALVILFGIWSIVRMFVGFLGGPV